MPTRSNCVTMLFAGQGVVRPIGSAVALATAATSAAQEAIAQPQLDVAAESHSMVWNAVAVVGERVFVAGPRWTGSRGPSLGVLAGKVVEPYPDRAWNGWRPGDPTEHRFVNVNAIHLEPGFLWVVDTGSPDFGGDPLPCGAKLVKIDISTGLVVRIYPLAPDVALRGSYVDDLRLNGRHAYLTDAGRPGLIVLDLETGMGRRVLDDHPTVTASVNRDVVLSGRVVRTANGEPLRVHSDPLELSPDARWLYFAPLAGPWSRVETRYLDDATVDPATLAELVEPWAELPPVGGTVMDADGSLYFSDLAGDAIKRRLPDGSIVTVVRDTRLHWVDAPFIDAQRRLWLPVPQMDRSSVFAGPDHPREWPVRLFRLQLPK